MDNRKSLTERCREKIQYHLVDSTALVMESTPVFAAFETGAAGMSDGVSINARLIAAGMAYAGIGYAYGKGRDIWRKTCGINEKTSERVQAINDLLYAGAFNLALSPAMYFISGSRDMKEIVIGTVCAAGFGALNGAPMGYAVDVVRDLSGVSECNRPSYPQFIKNQSPKMKKGLLALLVAGSIALTSGIYSMTSNGQEKVNSQTPQTIKTAK